MNRARIARMPGRVAERIAAGEVVERPAAVVKELIENALDAGAGEIEVRVLKGGKHLIEVADDGCGIDPEDLPLVFERHATSKLADESDLERLVTFGFRGEALASIAAAAEVTLVTRIPERPDAVELVSHPEHGARAPRPGARRPGTTVRVEHLFGHLPARRKFMRTDATELQRIRDLLRGFAVAHPERGLRFYAGDRLQWNLSPGSLDDRLAALYPDLRFLVADYETPRHRITARISHPHEHRGSPQDLHLLVNRRIVRDPLLRKAVQQAYERVLPPGRWPLGAVFIDLDPALVDVNVHPAKTEIRFLNPGGMFAELRDRLAAALREGRTPPGMGNPQEPDRLVDASPPPAADVADSGAAWPSSRRGRSGLSGPGPTLPGWSMPDGAREGPSKQGDMAPPDARDHADWSPDLQPLGAIGQRYLLFREGDALVMLDQHAAHERVRYDRIIAALEAGQAPLQELLTPAVWQPEPEELAGWRIGHDWLARAGFPVEDFGPETLRLRAVPIWFRGNPLQAVRDTLRELGRIGSSEALGRQAHDVAAGLACRGAILSGRNVPLAEQLELLRQLRETPGADTCPHGRPTWRRIEPAELDRWFGRS